MLFIEAKLDVVVLEVGIGGRLDGTNVIPKPVATAVTTLDYDHVEILGDTLTKIAREKAGIFRPEVPAYTCEQTPEAMDSLQTCADEVRSPI
jgi:folylpolyglutamate synthase/dihydropteroate synthase